MSEPYVAEFESGPLAGLTRLTRELVRIPSLPGKEGPVAALLSETMRECGFHRVWTDRAGNVIGHYEGRGGDGPTLLFDGHMDTVDIGDTSAWQHDPFGGEIVDGNLYGRGAADMKAALAAMVYGVKLLADQGARPNGNIVVAFVVQEEPCEGVAVRHLIEGEGLDPQTVVLGEPTSLGLYLGQRGRVELKVSTYGKAGHAALPQESVNAISAAARLIFGIELLGLQLHTDPQMGTGSIAVTQIASSAGSLNSIPELCELIIDRRLTLGETEARAVAELQGIINRERIKADISALTYEMVTYTGYSQAGRKYFPPWLVSEDDPVVRKAARGLERVLGARPKLGIWPFSTDGAYTMGACGIPTIGFGPGDERLAHTTDERVRLADVALAASGYAQLAMELLR
jgi:putative selenium metabolism hydrolase